MKLDKRTFSIIIEKHAPNTTAEQTQRYHDIYVSGAYREFRNDIVAAAIDTAEDRMTKLLMLESVLRAL